MKITSISITYGRKFRPAAFENLDIDVTLFAELEDGDNSQDVEDVLFSQAKAAVRKQALPVIAHSRNQVEKAFLALPEDQQNEIMDLAYSVKRNGIPDPEHDDSKDDLAPHPLDFGDN